MSLAIDYRPQKLSDVSGQTEVCNIIETMLRRQREGNYKFPAALLLYGNRGSGKTTTSRIIAKALNCQSVDQLTCGVCNSCREIAAGVSPNVIEIDAATNGKVDDIRGLTSVAHLAVGTNSYRVFIIDEAHSITKDGNNALLKQLEEPPPNVLYILVTTDPDEMMSTVLSRAIRFDFLPLDIDSIVRRLRIIAEKEKFAITDEVLTYLANHSEGSMRDAIMILETFMQFPEHTLEAAKNYWPDDLGDFAVQFIQTTIDNDSETGIKLIRDTYRRKRQAFLLIDAVITYVSDHALDRNFPLKRAGVYSNVMKNLWAVRVRARPSAQNSVTIIELLWHMLASDLNNSK